MTRIDFETAATGALPSGVTAALTGSGGPVAWAIVEDPTAPAGPKVLAQISTDKTDYRFPLAIFDAPVVADIDVAVRFGEPAASSLIRRKLAALQVITVATPGYLKRHGRPKHPNDLPHHACIHLRDPLIRQPYVWEFHKGRKVLTVKTRSRLLVSDARTMLTECVSGMGIAQVFTVAVRDFLENQQLVELFPDWPDEKFPLYAYFPSRHHPAAKVRAFVEFVLQAVR